MAESIEQKVTKKLADFVEEYDTLVDDYNSFLVVASGSKLPYLEWENRFNKLWIFLNMIIKSKKMQTPDTPIPYTPMSDGPMSEDKLQSQCFQWFWNSFPDLRRTLWHVPNGGNRNAREGAKFKAMGVLSGVHDLHLIHNSKLYTFELKVGTNKLSDDQNKYWECVEKQGAKCYLITTFEDFKETIFHIIKNEYK